MPSRYGSQAAPRTADESSKFSVALRITIGAVSALRARRQESDRKAATLASCLALLTNGYVLAMVFAIFVYVGAEVSVSAGMILPGRGVLPGGSRTVRFDALQRIGVGISRLGTSKATTIGAYEFAMRRLGV